MNFDYVEFKRVMFGPDVVQNRVMTVRTSIFDTNERDMPHK